MTKSAPHLRVIEETPAYWRVVFDNPPLNIMDADMFEALQDLLARMDTSPSLRVVVFESANPEFYLAHFDVKDTARTLTLLKTVGPSGLPSLLDTFVRLTKSPVVSIAKIRGRARGVSSEFLLACDMRFASRENTALAQVEVGSACIPAAAAPNACHRSSAGVARSKSCSVPTTSTARPLSDTATSIGRFRTRNWTASWMHSRAALPPLIGARSRQRRISSTTSRCHPPTASSTASRRLRRR